MKPCSLCGACIAVCPTKALSIIDEKIHLNKEKCIGCSICKKVCPDMTLTKDINIKYSAKAKTRLENIAQIAQNGGVASTIVYALLEEKAVDEAVAAARDFNAPRAISITNSSDAVKISGSRYFYTPILQEIDFSRVKDKKVCIIGLPCHIRAAFNLEKLMGVKFLKIGLFCFKNFYLSSIKNILESNNINVEKINRMEVVKKDLKIYIGSSIVSIKLSELKSSTKCLSCKCFIPFEADIALGNAGSSPSETTILVLSNDGLKALEVAEKYLEVDSNVNIYQVLKMQKIKEKIASKKKI
ncbi:MAG: hypothetical protein DRN04_06320 [Thermoprotei archaeon]|nr:MAG: hypothetical protein DRN04_06320 [Thermoprotei archaeon]